MKKLKHFAEYMILRAVAGVFGVLPESVAMRVACFIGWCLYKCIPIRKDVIRENLERAFPDKDEKFYDRVTRCTYQNLVMLFAEFVQMRRLDASNIRRKIVNFDESEQKVRDFTKGKGVIAVTGHLGNWELMGAYGSLSGHPITVIAKPLHNPYVDKFVRDIRIRNGYEIIHTGNLMKRIITKINSGDIVGFLSDQDAGKNGIVEDFFGTPASTHRGPALFAHRLGVPIIPVFCVRVSLTKYKMIYHDPIYPPDAKDLDKDEILSLITRQHIHALEDTIRLYPEQYFWFHKRWKTRGRKK